MTIYFFMIGSLLVGLLMLLRLRKEDKLYTFLGIGLILLSIWLFANDRLDGLLTTGWYAWVGRGVLVIVAFVLAYFFWQEEKKRRAAMPKPEIPHDPSDDILLRDSEEVLFEGDEIFDEEEIPEEEESPSEDSDHSAQ